MSLETTTNRIEAAGNGTTTAFSFPYYFLSQTDLKVILVTDSTGIGTVQTITTHYTVSGAGTASGGTVTMLTAPASGKTLVVYRDPPITQGLDLVENDSAPAESLERGYDKLTMISQRLAELQSRSITLPDAFVGTFDPELPVDIDTANAVLVVNAAGTGIEVGPTTTEIEDAEANAAAAAASAAAASTSASNASTSASAAATSASSAAATLASAFFRDVIYVTSASSPITVSQTENGKVYSIDSSGGAVTINLPTIAGITLPFNIAFVLTVAGNTVTINRGGTDTIGNAATSKTLSAVGTGCQLAADTDGTPDNWAALDFGSVADRAITSSKLAQSVLIKHVCEGRLTLTSGTPVTTSDVTGTVATTVYFTTYKGNLISLYDGSSTWDLYEFTERSLTVPSTTSTMYDVFIYNNSGTITMESVAWTNDTTRATALATQNGVYVKTGETNKRYLGSFRTTGSSGQTEDSRAKRYVWNYYNRAYRSLRVIDSTDVWTYSTATFRQTNAASGNQVDMVIGVSEDAISVTAISLGLNSGASLRTLTAGVGVGSTSVNSGITSPGGTSSTALQGSTATYKVFPAIGRQFYVWLERGDGTDTQTWRGDNGGTDFQTGIFGEIWG